MTTMRPLIALIGYTDINRYGNLSHVLPLAYTKAIDEAGGAPYILPFTTDSATLAETLVPARGCLFSGGVDIDPSSYGAEKKPWCGCTDIELDIWQIAVLERAIKAKLPILAICRGAQLVNVALGGTLYQDLFTEVNTPLRRHAEANAQPGEDHSINLAAGSRLHRLFGPKISVNSRHHQAIKKLGNDLNATAWADDGIIEGGEHGHLPIDLVQWHPELMVEASSATMLPLFSHLVANCS
jgi:putative glutamine amidotransferase